MKNIRIMTLVAIASFGCSQGLKPLTVSATSERATGGTTTTTTTTSSSSSTTLSSSDGTGGHGGQTGKRSYSCGNRNYVVKVPANYSDQTPIPVLVWFHGLGDNYQNFANQILSTEWATLGESENFILMFPNHQNPDRPSFLFLDSSQSQLDEPRTKAEVQSVYDCVLNGAGQLYNINKKHIHWAGFSEGGTFSSLASSYISDKLKSVTPISGGAPRRPPVSRLISVYYIVGTNDQAFSYVQNSANEFEHAGHSVNRSFISGVGHAMSPLLNAVGPRNVWNWMKSQPGP